MTRKSASNKTRNLFFLFLFNAVLLSFSNPLNAGAQVLNKNFSISFKEKSVAYILDFLSSKGEYKVNYTDDVKNDSLTLTISFDNVDELSAIQSVLKGTPFTYNVEGKAINVFKMQKNAAGKFTLKGLVKDKDGGGIPLATVQIKGTSVGTSADMDGNFTLLVDKEHGDVTVSSVGYETKTIKYDANKPLTITLPSSAYMVGEVSVIAYGKRNTREQVGAIGSVKAEDLQKNTFTQCRKPSSRPCSWCGCYQPFGLSWWWRIEDYDSWF